MSDQRYLQDERLIIHIASVVGIAIAILAILSAIFFRERRAAYIPKEEVWAFIETEATAAGLVPEFVYAIAWAESSLNANAESSVARGMMQLTKIAWREVSAQPYRDAWDWQTNVRVAIDYLSYCR
ncbi:MAG: lytic transglycosylase domain-containing protein, partial [Verrucomicrobiota bacterium]